MFSRNRSLTVRIGKKLRRRFDGWIARSSLVPNDEVLDSALFPWTARLRAQWREIRDEALAVLANPDAVPELKRISPDHGRIASEGEWRSFFLHGYGHPIPANIMRCPITAEVVAGIPGLNSAFFSILRPGTHIPAHRGVTKGLVTCHLGLQVPRGPVRMDVGDRTVGWAEGETLLFDDTYRHEVWNDTDETRVVLLIQAARPLVQPGKALAGAFLWGVRRSPFVTEATANLAMWEEALRRTEQAAQQELTEPDRALA